MGEELKDWDIMWGAKIKARNDMPDDMLKDAIETSRRAFESRNFDTEGLKCAELIKTEFDERWSPYWHCIVGRSFGSHVTHEMKSFAFFYLDDKAVLIFKAGC